MRGQRLEGTFYRTWSEIGRTILDAELAIGNRESLILIFFLVALLDPFSSVV